MAGAATDATPSETPGFATLELFGPCHRLLCQKARRSAICFYSKCEKICENSTSIHSEDYGLTIFLNAAYFPEILFRKHNTVLYNSIKKNKTLYHTIQ
jgi:hypothetical protein